MLRTAKVISTVVLAALVFALAPAQVATGTTQQPSVLTNELDKSLITYGGKVSLEAVLTVNSLAVPDATVELYRREYPATEFSFVTSAVTNASGKAVVGNLLPAKKTDYRWKFAGNEAAAASTSNWQTVKVRTKVTMWLEDPTISAGQKAVVRGKTAPPKPGATVKVFRTTIGGATSKWFTGTVGSDGRFKLSKRVPGTLKYRVFVVVVAHSGNAKGTSETYDLWVSP